MNPNINMSPILEALKRRQEGGGMGGGTAVPAQQQLSQPMGATPMGTSPTPMRSVPQMPNMAGQDVTNQFQGQGGGQGQGQLPPDPNQALQAGQKAQGPQFDDETRILAKSLVQRLLKAI